MKRWLRCIRHAWLEPRDTERALPADMADRLAGRIAASEQHHSGEIRICVEASLPLAMAWRIDADGQVLHQVTRERALQWFGQLRIWDTAQNNGVLIYLLLAERVIEIVADRGLACHVSQARWDAIARHLGERLKAQAFEDGLTEALAEVSALLVQHHPLERGTPNPDELPNAIVRA